MQTVDIRDDAIRLGQFLKLAGMADSGSDAKRMLESDEVRVNDEPERRRGRWLYWGDVVFTTHRGVAQVSPVQGSQQQPGQTQVENRQTLPERH